MFLSNEWMNWFFSNYSIAIMGVPSVIAFMLKLAAIYHPGVNSDKVADLIQAYWPSAGKETKEG